MGTGPTPPQKSPTHGGGEVSSQGKVRFEGESLTKGEKIISLSPPTPSARKDQEDRQPDLTRKQESLLEAMKRRKKEKEDTPVRKKPGKKEIAARKEEEEKKAAGVMMKMLRKLKEAPSDKAAAAGNKGDNKVVKLVDFDRKTVVNEEGNKFIDRKAVGEEGMEGRVQGSPPGRIGAALKKFNHTSKQEESYEEWKKNRIARKVGEKRKAVVDEDPGTKESNITSGTPSKFRKISVPGRIQNLKLKFNNLNTSPRNSGQGGQVQLARSNLGGEGDAVLGSGAIKSPDRMQQRDAGGKIFILSGKMIAAAERDKKLDSGGTADCTDVQYRRL